MGRARPDNPSMAILKIARLGNPVLREVARELSAAEIRSDTVKQLVQDMKDTMDDYGGVGLAAPQVHESVRLAILEFDADEERYDVDESQPCLVVFNPRVHVLDATLAGFWEGCLSVPGMRGHVERPSKIRIDYLDEQATPASIEAEGFLATVCQHEIDHLEGVLYVDKLSDPTSFAFTEEYSRYHIPDEDDADESD